jgi:hypothetical protein
MDDPWGDFERLNVRPCRPYFVRSLATSIPDFNCISVPKTSAAQHPAPGSWFPPYRDWKAEARQLMLALHAQLVEPLALSGYA